MRDELMPALRQRLLNLVSKPHGGGLDATTADELAVEPGGGLGRDLAIEGDGGVDLDNKLAALAFVVGRCPLQEVARDVPTVGVEAADNARPPQRLKAADVGLDVAFDVPARDARRHPGELVVLLGLVEPVVAGGVGGDGLVDRAR